MCADKKYSRKNEKKSGCNERPESISTDKRHIVICDNLDGFSQEFYNVLFKIMKSEAANFDCYFDEYVRDYLNSWFELYLNKPFIKKNLIKICTSETPQNIVSYLRKTFRNHIKQASQPKNFHKRTLLLEDAFRFKDSDEANIPGMTTPPEPYHNPKRLTLIRDIILNLKGKQSKAFLNQIDRSKHEPRDKYLEEETQANRNQLVKRMRDSLKKEFEKHRITHDEVDDFLESEYLSEIKAQVLS